MRWPGEPRLCDTEQRREGFGGETENIGSNDMYSFITQSPKVITHRETQKINSNPDSSLIWGTIPSVGSDGSHECWEFG